MDDETIDALKSFIESRLEEMNVCLPATVNSYDGRLAAVTPDLPKQIADGRVLAAPVIHNVPVRWLTCDINGGLARVTGPLKSGDGGLLVFSQRSIDAWISGSAAAPDDPRMFDINDAFFIPGVNRGSTVPAADTANLCVLYGGGGLKVSADGTTTFIGPVVFEKPMTANDTADFNQPVTMAAAAPIVAGGGITGKDGYAFETHEHDVALVQGGNDTKRSGPPVA